VKGSPSELYQKDWCLGKNGSVDVAYKKSNENELYAIRRISKSDAEEQVANLRQLNHKNLVLIHEAFKSQQGFFIVSPYQDISLVGINGSPRYPSEPQLAALIYEVSMPSLISMLLLKFWRS
jgi:hypothetical protein